MKNDRAKSLVNTYVDAASASLPDAQCLPFSLYTDDSFYQIEREKVFHQDWVFVCAEQQLPDKGDYLALSLADEPIVIIRGTDGVLRALSNVCRHRGTLLNDEGRGRVKRMVCPYHAWTYATDGRLVGVPYEENGLEVDKLTHCLPEFSIELWHGLIFVCLVENPQSLKERYASLDRYLALYESSRFTVYYPGSTEHWQCNWKLAMENAMESYHLFKVHKQTLEALTPTQQAFYLEGGISWSLTGGRYKNSSGKLSRWLLGEGGVTDQHYILISLPPSFVGILSQDAFSWVGIYPIGVNECVVRSGSLSLKGGSVDREEEVFSAAFLAEDKAICERVQRGMSARVGRGGTLIEMERIIVDFHRYLASRMGAVIEPATYIGRSNPFFE